MNPSTFVNQDVAVDTDQSPSGKAAGQQFESDFVLGYIEPGHKDKTVADEEIRIGRGQTFAVIVMDG